MHARADDVRDNIIILLDECLTLLASSANLPVVFKMGKQLVLQRCPLFGGFFKVQLYEKAVGT